MPSIRDLINNPAFIPPAREGYEKAFDSLQWLLNRPSQAINQGVAAGFRGENPLPDMLGGLVGSQPDVTMSKELDQPEQWGDFWNERMVRLGHLLDYLSPLDLAMPGGRALARPMRGIIQYEKLAPEYKKIADKLGGPLEAMKDLGSSTAYVAKDIAKDLMRGRSPTLSYEWGKKDLSRKMHPEDLWGKYGMEYVTQPRSVESKLPLIMRTQAPDVMELSSRLGFKEPLNAFGFFEKRPQKLFGGESSAGNLIATTAKRPKNIKHEASHYIGSALWDRALQTEPIKRQAAEHFRKAGKGSKKISPKQYTDDLKREILNEYQQFLHRPRVRDYVDEIQRRYDPTQWGEELLVRTLAGQSVTPPMIKNNPTYRALEQMLEGNEFIPRSIYDPTPMPPVPTPLFSIPRRAMTREEE